MEQNLEAGLRALAAGDAASARAILERVVRQDQNNSAGWLALAQACAATDDGAGEMAALDRSLTLQPRNIAALLAKGDALWRRGDKRAAAPLYGGALRLASASRSVPAALQASLDRARGATEELARELEAHVRESLNARGFDARNAPRRFTQAVEIMLGKSQAYQQAPRYFYFPGLPAQQFFDRRDFAWAASVEAQWADIRDELQSVISSTGAFAPYVAADSARPERRQAGLAGSPSWGAFFLHKDGAKQAGAERCPKTYAALSAAPLTQIPGRAPSILFSKLAPGAHIPPHTGMINTRLICHLPIVAPPQCALRVGDEVRTWREGELLVFDDTIEHEAWNRSEQDRYVLLFDIWRPDISHEEREAVAALCQTIDSFGGGAAAPWEA